MKVELRYFSGTGNSFKIIDTCRDVFVENGCTVTLSSITNKTDLDKNADLIGFCFPVYAFGIPRICRKYLSAIPEIKNPINTFVLITAGDSDEAGFSVKESRNLLKQKGLKVNYTEVIEMPANWTVSMDPPSKNEARSIINKGVNKTRETAQSILDGVSRNHVFNYPARYSKLGFYKDYFLFKWLGVKFLWAEFKTDETCDACGICEKLCPTESIKMIDERPKWSDTCEQCMRCVNYCPEQAIYQKSGGSIKGKNSYKEPSFKPLKSNKISTNK